LFGTEHGCARIQKTTILSENKSFLKVNNCFTLFHGIFRADQQTLGLTEYQKFKSGVLRRAGIKVFKTGISSWQKNIWQSKKSRIF